MLGGFEPGGAVLFVDVAAFAQVGDGLVDLAVRVQAVLVEPHVEVHAEVLHGSADFVEHHRHCALAEFLTLFGVTFAERFALVVLAAVDARQIEDVDAVGLGFIDDALRDFIDIGTLVAVDRGLFAVGGRHEGFGETVNLLAMVIEVVFAHDLGAIGFEHAGHGVADGGPASAADMDGAGRVGGDEFEIQGLTAEMVVLAVGVAGFKHGIDHGRCGSGVEHDVDEAGTGHFHGLDTVGLGQFGREQLSQIVRFHTGFFSQLHGRIGGPVAVCAVLRAHHGELGHRGDQLVGQGACLTGGNESMGNLGNQFT